MQTRALQEVLFLTDVTFLFKVFLGGLALQAQLVRKESQAMMEFQGQRERKVNQVCQAPIHSQNEILLRSKTLPSDLQAMLSCKGWVQSGTYGLPFAAI